MNRIGWLDTMRVLALLLVLISHFAYRANAIPSIHEFISQYVLFIGQIGNMLFFAVSGYLAANSLERTKSIFEFYRRKIIRITVPYTFAYIILCIILLFLGIFEPKITDPLPLKTYLADENYFGIFLGMLPVASDFNLIKILDLSACRMIGEWFIGTIIWLYLISPLLFKILNQKFFATFISAIIIAGFTYDFTPPLEEAGVIAESTILFPVWIPSFLLGMILHLYRNFILNNLKNLTTISIFLSVVLIFYSIYHNVDAVSIWEKIILGNPINFWQYMFANVLFVYFLYVISKFLNGNFSKFCLKFNKLSNISYVAMLIQNLVISGFFNLHQFTDIDKFGVIILLTLIILTVLSLSFVIHKIYKPIEEKLIRKEAISLGG